MHVLNSQHKIEKDCYSSHKVIYIYTKHTSIYAQEHLHTHKDSSLWTKD
jgi:hypothetical protein